MLLIIVSAVGLWSRISPRDNRILIVIILIISNPQDLPNIRKLMDSNNRTQETQKNRCSNREKTSSRGIARVVVEKEQWSEIRTTMRV